MYSKQMKKSYSATSHIFGTLRSHCGRASSMLRARVGMLRACFDHASDLRRTCLRAASRPLGNVACNGDASKRLGDAPRPLGTASIFCRRRLNSGQHLADAVGDVPGCLRALCPDLCRPQSWQSSEISGDDFMEKKLLTFTSS